jgi:hypothetical protein
LWRWHDVGPPCSGRYKYTVIPHDVEPRGRDDRSQLLHQLERFKYDVRAIAPPALEAMQEPVGQQRQTLDGQRRTRGVTTELLEPRAGSEMQ